MQKMVLGGGPGSLDLSTSWVSFDKSAVRRALLAASACAALVIASVPAAAQALSTSTQQAGSMPSADGKIRDSSRTSVKALPSVDIGQVIDRSAEAKASQFAAGGGLSIYASLASSQSGTRAVTGVYLLDLREMIWEHTGQKVTKAEWSAIVARTRYIYNNYSTISPKPVYPKSSYLSFWMDAYAGENAGHISSDPAHEANPMAGARLEIGRAIYGDSQLVAPTPGGFWLFKAGGMPANVRLVRKHPAVLPSLPYWVDQASVPVMAQFRSLLVVPKNAMNDGISMDEAMGLWSESGSSNLPKLRCGKINLASGGIAWDGGDPTSWVKSLSYFGRATVLPGYDIKASDDGDFASKFQYSCNGKWPTFGDASNLITPLYAASVVWSSSSGSLFEPVWFGDNSDSYHFYFIKQEAPVVSVASKNGAFDVSVSAVISAAGSGQRGSFGAAKVDFFK